MATQWKENPMHVNPYPVIPDSNRPTPQIEAVCRLASVPAHRRSDQETCLGKPLSIGVRKSS